MAEPRRLDGSERARCPRIVASLDPLLRRWSIPIIDVLLQRPARFCELSRAVPGLSERVMTERLRELAEVGLVERRVEPGPPVATIYQLTGRGHALQPVVGALLAWAADAGGPQSKNDRSGGLKP